MTQVEIVLEKIKSVLNRSVIDNNSNTIDEKIQMRAAINK